MSITRDIKILLAGIESNIFVGAGNLPDQPDSAILISGTGGYNPEDTHDGSTYGNPTFQVWLRNEAKRGGYDSGRARCEAIVSILHLISNQYVNGTRYLIIRQMGDILEMGPDKKRRQEFSMNFVAQVGR